MNFNFSAKIISSLMEWGVKEFYICAGARNIPLIEILLQSNKKNVFSHFEERSAAFYALGRIKALQSPVAIIVTSGTAVGELLPAVMEGYYSGLPLVVVTADRPRKQRGTGAPQTAEQKNIFGIYTSACIDIEAWENLDISALPKNMPLHINPCFDIPLQSNIEINFDEFFSKKMKSNLPTKHPENKIDIENIKNFLKVSKNLLVIVSQLTKEEANSVVPFLIKLGAPVYLESISNLRETPELNNIKIYCPDKIWKNSEKSSYTIDAILKIGGTPTHRIWRDLEESKQNINVFSISKGIFSGSSRASHLTADLNSYFQVFCNDIFEENFNFQSNKKLRNFLEADKSSYKKLEYLFEKYPNSEQTLIFYLSKLINKKANIYLGNSLPIRTWDLAATYENNDFYIEASRGLNGIDGQISTFLGCARADLENWAILGDLTTLYDLAGLWALQYRPNLNLNIVVINNSGGKIFKGVLQGKAALGCQNQHKLCFKSWAEMWGVDYEILNSTLNKEIINNNLAKQRVVEIVPNELQTEGFSKEFHLL